MINQLSTYRKAKGFSQEEFATKLGVTTTTLSLWENVNYDLRKLKYIKLSLICELLNINLKDLISEEK